jgi:alkylation response protein AidB-like acyl-CoA dehydrogenase
VKLENVAIGADRVLGAAGEGWRLIDRIVDRAKVALCAEMCGGAQRVLDMSSSTPRCASSSAADRQLPGDPAQMRQHAGRGRELEVDHVLRGLGGRERRRRGAARRGMAKAYCSDAYRHTAGEGIQIHGGIGFTWEHDMHLYFKRAKSSEVTFGDATWNRELVAQLINL